MGLAGFLRKLQEFYTKHKTISTIFACLFVIPPSYFYSFYATTHLSNVFLTKISEDAHNNNNFVGTTLYYISFIAQVEGFVVVGIAMFSLLIPIFLILASEQKIDPEARLSIKSFILTISKHARSLFVTWFFVRLFKLGYIFLGLLLMLVFHDQHLTFINSSSCDQQHELSDALISSISFGTIIFLAGGVLIFAYLATFGNMALDISVREGISGTKALEKASQVLEGKWKIIGFVVNVVLGVVSFGVFVCYVYLNTCSKLSVESKKSIMLNLWNLGIYQVEFYTWTFFSILYSGCKKSHGETITTFQPQGSFKRIMQEEQPFLGY